MNTSRAKLLLPVGLAASLTVSALLTAPRVAHAQDESLTGSSDAVARVVALNRKGVAFFQKGRFDEARRLLKEALGLCEEAGLDRHPVAARTHIHLGIVIAAGFGQRDIGAKQFRAALAIDPSIGLTPSLATPALQEIFDEAAALAPASSPAQVAQDERRPAAPRRDDSGADDSELPAPIKTFGLHTPGAARVERRGKNDDDEDEDDARLSGRRLQLGLSLGLASGWAGGNADLNADTPVAGSFVGARLDHLEASAGFWLSSAWMVSLDGRFQRVSGTTDVEANGHTYRAAGSAIAGFAAVTWSPLARAALRPFVSAFVGGGEIRHVVTLPGLMDCGPSHAQACVDTVVAGPLLGGAGGGVTFDVAAHVALVAGARVELGAPRFTFNVDLDGGVALRL